MKDSLEKRFQNLSLYIQKCKRQSGNGVVEKHEMRYGAVIEGRGTSGHQDRRDVNTAD